MDQTAAADLHNRLARELVSRIASERFAAGDPINDVLNLCEEVLLGVLLSRFDLGRDAKALDLIAMRVKERLNKVRSEDLKIRGGGER